MRHPKILMLWNTVVEEFIKGDDGLTEGGQSIVHGLDDDAPGRRRVRRHRPYAEHGALQGLEAGRPRLRVYAAGVDRDQIAGVYAAGRRRIRVPQAMRRRARAPWPPWTRAVALRARVLATSLSCAHRDDGGHGRHRPQPGHQVRRTPTLSEARSPPVGVARFFAGKARTSRRRSFRHGLAPSDDSSRSFCNVQRRPARRPRRRRRSNIADLKRPRFPDIATVG